MKNHNKIIVILAMSLMMVGSLQAQVFIQDDEFEGTLRTGYEDFELLTPVEGMEADQFTPLGDGVAVLVGLGGAYLIAKRKEKR